MRIVHIRLQIPLYFYYKSSNVLYRVELFVCSYVVVVVTAAFCCCSCFIFDDHILVVLYCIRTNCLKKSGLFAIIASQFLSNYVRLLGRSCLPKDKVPKDKQNNIVYGVHC